MQIRILEDVAAFVFEKAIRGRLKKDRMKEFQSGIVLFGLVDSLEGYRDIQHIKNAIPLKYYPLLSRLQRENRCLCLCNR